MALDHDFCDEPEMLTMILLFLLNSKFNAVFPCISRVSRGNLIEPIALENDKLSDN